MTGTLATSLLPLLMIAAGVGDAFTLRIPNWLTAAVALLFFPMAFGFGMPLDQFGWHLVTAAGLLAIGFGLFAFGYFGGGDAKLMAAAGLWFGWPAAGHFLIYTVLAGGALALAVLMISRGRNELAIKGRDGLAAWIGAKPDVPYGLALAVGSIFAFPQSWWMGFGL